jgi:hypothetical protein
MVVDCHKVGEIDFGDSYLLRMHLYVCTKWRGQVGESEEMRPVWFPLDKIPYQDMWKDDLYWLPLVLQGKKIKATFNFMNTTTIKAPTTTISSRIRSKRRNSKDMDLTIASKSVNEICTRSINRD